MNQNRFPFLAALLALAAVSSFVSPSAKADVYWKWSFGTEAGVFRTDGTFSDTAGMFQFTVIDFYLTASGQGIPLGSLLGGQILENQPTQGFIWNGTGVTTFFRQGGAFMNGSNYYSASAPDFRYGFVPNTGINADDTELGSESTPTVYTQGPLSITPISNPTFARPDIRIGKKSSASSHKGNGRYNTSGAGQKLKVLTTGGKRAQYFLSVESDSDVPDPVMLRAKKAKTEFQNKYFVREAGRWANRTANIRKSGYIVPDSAYKPVEVRIRTKAKGVSGSARQVLRLEAISTTSPGAKDVARATVTAK